jgi:hypothetical protein
VINRKLLDAAWIMMAVAGVCIVGEYFSLAMSAACPLRGPCFKSWEPWVFGFAGTAGGFIALALCLFLAGFLLPQRRR